MAIIGKLIILYWGIISRKDFIKGIKGMRLYFSVQNALTITGYKGLDPEVGGSL